MVRRIVASSVRRLGRIGKLWGAHTQLHRCDDRPRESNLRLAPRVVPPGCRRRIRGRHRGGSGSSFARAAEGGARGAADKGRPHRDAAVKTTLAGWRLRTPLRRVARMAHTGVLKHLVKTGEPCKSKATHNKCTQRAQGNLAHWLSLPKQKCARSAPENQASADRGSGGSARPHADARQLASELATRLGTVTARHPWGRGSSQGAAVVGARQTRGARAGGAAGRAAPPRSE